jgi:hypothetical protein
MTLRAIAFRNVSSKNSYDPKSSTMDTSFKPSFNFVNLTHPDELKNEETQLRIRRLAMTEAGRARRKPKKGYGRNEIVLDFRTTPRAQENHTNLNELSGGSIDPFASYPIDLDEASRALIVNSE